MNAPDLFRERRAAMSQYFTPAWAAEAILDRYFATLGSADLVLEPSCGDGAFLAALPDSVPAVGVEIDPEIAEAARRNSGREVICGDFRNVPLSISPTAIVGNPPFEASVFDGMLDRARQLLPDGAPAGFILPAYMLQTPSRVDRYVQHWSLTVELMPRTLWQRLSKPLVFCLFRRGADRVLVGFALYREARSLEHLDARYQDAVRAVSRSAWGQAVALALANLGGEADLPTLYRAMEKRRPTGNQWWKDKVRQVVQRAPFVRTGAGRYALQEAA